MPGCAVLNFWLTSSINLKLYKNAETPFCLMVLVWVGANAPLHPYWFQWRHRTEGVCVTQVLLQLIRIIKLYSVIQINPWNAKTYLPKILFRLRVIPNSKGAKSARPSATVWRRGWVVVDSDNSVTSSKPVVVLWPSRLKMSRVDHTPVIQRWSEFHPSQMKWFE